MGGSAILQSATVWAKSYADIAESVHYGNMLRQEVSSLQHEEGDPKRPRWPGAASNPLARLHISVVVNLDDACSTSLKVMLGYFCYPRLVPATF